MRRWFASATAKSSSSSLAASASSRPSSLYETILPKLRESLAKELKMTSLTHTQNDVMRVLFSGRNLIIKSTQDKTLQKSLTMAYLVPVLNKILVCAPNTKLCAPRAILFGPTAQYVAQTAELVSRLAPEVRIVKLTCGDVDVDGVRDGNDEELQQVNRLYERPVDLIIAEPTRVSELAQQNILKRDALQVVVCDDMDSMYQKDFYELMYFYAKIDVKVRLAMQLAVDGHTKAAAAAAAATAGGAGAAVAAAAASKGGPGGMRDVRFAELEQPPNSFQSVMLVDMLALTRVQGDFACYLEKPTTMIDVGDTRPPQPQLGEQQQQQQKNAKRKKKSYI